MAAYHSCIETSDDKTLSAKIAEFKQDHLQHVVALNGMARELGIAPPTEGDMKQMLTTGKIAGRFHKRRGHFESYENE